jgi:hypothetical protein
MVSRLLSSVQIFGTLSTVDVTYASIGFLLVIISVVILEAIVYKLDGWTVGTPYGTIVAGIQKELMIAGAIAFILKVN